MSMFLFFTILLHECIRYSAGLWNFAPLIQLSSTIFGKINVLDKLTSLRCRYEALPSNYGLGYNMLAGAFAGIAV